MPKQYQKPDQDFEQNKKPKRIKNEMTLAIEQTTHNMPALPSATTANFQNQSNTLRNPRLSLPQRQMLAGEISQVQGNFHLQQVMRKRNAPIIQRDADELNLPNAEGPSLNVGELSLDLSLLSDMPVETTFAPDHLFQLPPEFVEALVNEWWSQYLLLHPGPPPAQDVWEQICSAWRSLTNEWLAQGEDALFNQQMAQEIIRDRAAEAVITQLYGEEAENSPDLGKVGKKVWQAFERALNKTDFYPRVLANTKSTFDENWPVLIPLIGSAFGTSLGLGLSDNEWRPMQSLIGLLPMLDFDIDLGHGWTLLLGFGESAAIVGEEGSVIGVNPQVGVTWEGDFLRLTVGSSTNFRIEGETGEVHADPGGNITLEIFSKNL